MMLAGADLGLMATYLAACAAAAATGAMFNPDAWYRALSKPRWTPPPPVFPIAWTTLYLLMSWAAARVGTAGAHPQAQAFWALQIALNTLWTPIFFGLHRIRAAMVVMICLWLAVAATAVAFWQADPIAGAAMIPYVLWVTVAAALNLAVLRLNPQAA